MKPFKKIIICASAFFAVELLIFAVDAGKYTRLLNKLSKENILPIQGKIGIQSDQPFFHPESLYAKMKYWLTDDDVLNHSERAKEKNRIFELYGIRDTVLCWNVVEWRAPISKTAGGYSCGSLCGQRRESFYFYLFGFWVLLFHGSSWIA